MSKILFYSRYVPFTVADAQKKGFPLRGKSPFAENGGISIDEQGDFDCKATGRKGSQQKFLKELYPYLTTEGIKAAIKLESTDEPDLDKPRFESEIAQFRSGNEGHVEFENMCGFAASKIKSQLLWYNAASNHLHYIQLSVTGSPICRFTWRPNTRNETIVGVPRIMVQGNFNRLWFVEDALQAAVLSSKVSDPVLVRPSEFVLPWNDYEKLVDGREIICVHGDDAGKFEYTSYPLLNAVSSKAKTWTDVYYSPLTGGLPFAKWLTHDSKNSQQLLKVVRNCLGQTPRVVTKQVYNSYISNDSRKFIHFPQDKGANMYWYGTVGGKLAHSVPVNRMAPDEVLQKKNLEVRGNTQNQIQTEGIRLTDSELMNILSSGNQLTPKWVFNHLRYLIQRHVYFSNKDMPSLVTLWIIGGYVYKLFPAYGYLRLNGLAGTGKTTLLNIIKECGFNGTFQSQITKSGMAETVHYLACTLCLDEAEKNSLSTQDEYLQLLKAGYKSDGSYSKKSGNTVRRLNVYSPKAIASIDPLDDEALDSRTLTIKTVLKPRNVSLEQWDTSVGDIANEVNLARRGCYSIGLRHHKTIERLYRRIPPEICLPSEMKVDNRKRQIVAPLLAIAQLVDTNSADEAESSLLKALNAIWNPVYKEAELRMKLLHDQLKKWGDEASFSSFTEKEGYMYIPNNLWTGTALSKHLGGQAKTVKWFGSLKGIKKQSMHIPKLNTKSCTGFPLDLNIHKKTVREIFSSKTG